MRISFPPGKQPVDVSARLARHGFDIVARVDALDALRVRLGEQVVSVAHAHEERLARAFEPVELRSRVAAQKSRARIEREQQRQIGHRAVDGGRVQLRDRLHAQLAPRALIGDGRIDKPVAQDDLAALERRANDLAHMFAARGGIKQRLGFAAHRLFRIENQRADILADGCAAGFARMHHFIAHAADMLGDGVNLRSLAAAVQPLDRQEKTARRGRFPAEKNPGGVPRRFGHRVRAVRSQFLRRAEAPCRADRVDSQRLGRFHVVQPVAYHRGARISRRKRLTDHDFLARVRVDRRLADHAVEKAREAEALQQPRHKRLRLRAGHRHKRALRAQLAQQLRHARINARVKKHFAVINLAEKLVEADGLFLRQPQIALSGIENGRSDEPARKRVVHGRAAHLPGRILQRLMDARHRIGNRAVKIKQNRVVSHVIPLFRTFRPSSDCLNVSDPTDRTAPCSAAPKAAARARTGSAS